MAEFDFISGEDFRNSLEADYREMNSAMEVQAWKAVHVLAGSIIEALLVDYLVSSNYKTKDPLNMRFEDLIAVCTQKNVLSKKTEQISHAIRSYRNLIHPGRIIRLNETVDEDGAKVAQALVKIVIKEVAARRKENYGYTAEQIVSKVERDSSVMPILGHLLKNTSEFELKRLLLKIIPQRYFEIIDPINRPEDAFLPKVTLTSLATSFRMSFEAVSEETKKEVAKEFVRILKEESAEVVRTYEVTFLKGEDLQYIPPEELSIAKEHLLSVLANNPHPSLLNSIQGIGEFLTPSEAGQFTSMIMRPLIRKSSDQLDSGEVSDIKISLDMEYVRMTSEAKAATMAYLQHLVQRFKEGGNEIQAAMIQNIIDYLTFDPLEDPPF